MAGHDDDRDFDERDLGPPVAELALLRVRPARGWLHRIRERINRKLLVADGLEFFFQALSRTFMVYLGSLLQLFAGQEARRGRRR